MCHEQIWPEALCGEGLFNGHAYCVESSSLTHCVAEMLCIGSSSSTLIRRITASEQGKGFNC